MKNATIDGYGYLTGYSPGPDLHCAGHLALRGFPQRLSSEYK